MKMVLLLNFTRKFGVVALAFWLAGAGCLLGCESMVTAAAEQDRNLSSSTDQSSTIVAEGDACASSESHGCCKKKTRANRSALADAGQVDANTPTAQNSTESWLAESSTTGMNDCPFAISRAVAVAKIYEGQTGATAAVSHALPAAAVREQKLSLSTISPMPNRGHTYLRCCSLLI